MNLRKIAISPRPSATRSDPVGTQLPISGRATKTGLRPDPWTASAMRAAASYCAVVNGAPDTRILASYGRMPQAARTPEVALATLEIDGRNRAPAEFGQQR